MNLSKWLRLIDDEIEEEFFKKPRENGEINDAVIATASVLSD